MDAANQESPLISGRRIAFDVGERLQLEIEGVPISLDSQVIGFEHDVFILIKTPRPYPTIMHKLNQGSQVYVKYMFQGRVFAFQAKIVESITNPYRLLFLEYPKMIQHMDSRDFKRIECIIPAMILVKNATKQGTIVDISSQGCRVQIPIYPKEVMPFIGINDDVFIEAKFPGIKKDLELIGKVRNLRKSRHEISLGIIFKGLPMESRDKIDQYLDTIEDMFRNDM